MKVNLRLLLQKRRVKPEVWCRDNGIRTQKQLEQFLVAGNYIVDQPLEEWVKFEPKPNKEQPLSVVLNLEAVVDSASVVDETREVATEKPKRQNKKTKSDDSQS
jgi:hypothetical protein